MPGSSDWWAAGCGLAPKPGSRGLRCQIPSTQDPRTQNPRTQDQQIWSPRTGNAGIPAAPTPVAGVDDVGALDPACPAPDAAAMAHRSGPPCGPMARVVRAGIVWRDLAGEDVPSPVRATAPPGHPAPAESAPTPDQRHAPWPAIAAAARCRQNPPPAPDPCRRTHPHRPRRRSTSVPWTIWSSPCATWHAPWPSILACWACAKFAPARAARPWFRGTEDQPSPARTSHRASRRSSPAGLGRPLPPHRPSGRGNHRPPARQWRHRRRRPGGA